MVAPCIMTRLAVLFLVVLAGSILGTARSRPADLTRLRDYLVGSFSSAAQAARDSSYFDIRLEVVPIWTARAEDGYWLYVEQAAANALARPYRQRVYHLVNGPEGRLISYIYTLPRPLRFAGSFRDPARFESLTSDSLELRSGCEVILAPTRQGFAGATRVRACPSELRGAAYATSEVSLTPTQMQSWDRGFDDTGRQVWGALTGPYIFDRVR